MSELGHIARTPATAVGAGIAATIRAQAASRSEVDSPEAWIHFCCTAADEAYAAVLDHPPVSTRPLGSAERLLRKLQWDGQDEDNEVPYPAELFQHTGPAEGEELTAAAHSAALVAFRACMPNLTNRRNTQAYLACVAVGVRRGYFTGPESKNLFYAAQLALAAFPSRRAPRGRK